MARRPSVTLTAVLTILGFLLVAAHSATTASKRAEQPRRQQLVSLIEDRRKLVGDLDEAVSKLRADVERARAGAARLSELDRAEAERLSRLGAIAGTTAMRGPGLVVRLADSDRQPPSAEDAEAYRIHDRDLQLVVNALFANGAEAVAVNESRVVATTPIREAGTVVVVNFRPLTPPYRIVALGADAEGFAESEEARRFKRWSNLFGLGFRVDRESDLRVPGFTGRVAINTATPEDA